MFNLNDSLSLSAVQPSDGYAEEFPYTQWYSDRCHGA